jgi:hypothetical protein
MIALVLFGAWLIGPLSYDSDPDEWRLLGERFPRGRCAAWIFDKGVIRVCRYPQGGVAYEGNKKRKLWR